MNKQKVIIPIYNNYPQIITAIEVYEGSICDVNQAIADYWGKYDCDEKKFIERLKELNAQDDMGLKFLPKESVNIYLMDELIVKELKIIPFDFSADQFVGTPNPTFPLKTDPAVKKILHKMGVYGY